MKRTVGAFVRGLSFFFAMTLGHAVGAVTSQVPLYLTTSATPLMMLTMSRDEQLFKKAYTDYTDLDGNGTLDTTYNDGFDYSGYFDSRFCYTYASSQFKAAALATDLNANGKAHECGTTNTGRWSGNFLNWMAMSRIDVLRFVFYGGGRSTDSATKTVLERAHIPNDLHAWVKVYADTNAHFTPFTGTQSFCNASFGVNDSPKIRRAPGAWSEWAATSLTQCSWDNGSDTPAAGGADNEFVARVEVCDSTATTLRESFCKAYGTSLKPVGLLQEYGEPKDGKAEGLIRFGLLGGTFSNPRSGGVLRRNIGKLSNNANVATAGACTTGDEIDLRDGTFCNQGDGTEGIINTMNRLKLTQWSGSSWSDCNTYGIHNRTGGNGRLNNPGSTTDAHRECSAWGNPLSEMYAEALRYISNEGKTAAFGAGNDLNGLPAPNWADPYRSTATGGNPSCATCSLLVLSSGLSSFDSDEIPTSTKLDRSAAVATEDVGKLEGINNNLYFGGRLVPDQATLAVGQEVNTHEDLCTSLTVSDLSLVRGLCPDIPSQEGSYLLAGLAYQARTQDLRKDITPKIKPINANTYTVALAENLPKFNISIPAVSSTGTISFAPLCQANNSGSADATSTGWRSCYLGSVTVGPKTASIAPNYMYGRDLEADNSAGSFSLVWEDSQWGNDHDNDVVTMITYCVGSKCQRTTGPRNGLGANDGVAYTGYDICWRSDSAVCGANGSPIVGPDEVLVRVENLSAYAGNAMLTGYSITGSSSDGVKRVALRPGNSNGSILTSVAAPPADWARPKVLRYSLGTSTTKLLENPLWYAAKYGAFTRLDKTKADTPIVQGQSSWDKSNVGVPDAYFKVTDPAKLKQSLNTVFNDVLERSSTAATIATNSTRLDTDTLIFQAKFNSADWSGELIAYELNSDGSVGGVAWDTNTTMPFPTSPSARKVFTWNESATIKGVAFNWSALSTAQKTLLGGGDAALGQNRLDWIRGSRLLESDKVGGIFRKRNYLLGDVVNSDPAFVGEADFGYSALPIGAAGQDTYAAFEIGKSSRKQMLYFGANDGMLHAVDAKLGEEVFAYVPGGVYSNLATLTSPSYSHRYYVDGAPNSGDAYFSSDSSWHTLLIGSTGAGGSSVFMLDVTNPDSFDGSKVLWEISNGTAFPDLGQTIGYGTIGRLKNGTWVAIFGNGYGSPSGQSVLYIVNAQTGALISAISACSASPCTGDTATSPNGLSTPALLVDANRNIVAAYAGDLKGNLWKFNLDTTGTLEVAYKTSGKPAPLFKANRPITAPLDIGIHPSGGYMIYFGTGKYYETDDNKVGANPPVDAFYGIWDNGSNIVDPTKLLAQTIIAEATVPVVDQKGTASTADDVTTNYKLRGVSANAINWANNGNQGWYLALQPPTGGAQGERVVRAPQLRNGRVIFPTLIPSSESCDAGGTSWIMELDALTGGRTASAVFDLNNDGLFTVGDHMPFGTTGSIPPSGMGSEVGMTGGIAIISAGAKEHKLFGGSTGNVGHITEKGDPRAGRQSWRQIR